MTTTEQIQAHLRTADLSRARDDTAARAMGMSETTMRRRLRAEGTTWQKLLDAERMRRTAECLEKWGRRAYGKRLFEMLGYAEVNSFYRSYRRCSGECYEQVRMRG